MQKHLLCRKRRLTRLCAQRNRGRTYYRVCPRRLDAGRPVQLYKSRTRHLEHVFAADFANPVIAGKQVDSLIAGNDAQALETVSELAKNIGITPLVAGDLLWSRTLENMALLLIQLTMKNNYNWVAGWKVLHN